MLRLLLPVLTLLAIAPTASAQDGDTPVPAGPLESGAIERAEQALAAGNASEALALLEPRPLTGPGTCVYGNALLRTASTPPITARALLYLERCQASIPDSNLREQIAGLRKQLGKSSLAKVSLSLRPASATARVSGGYEGDTLLAEDDIWLALGKHRLEIVAPGHTGGAYAVDVDSRERMLVPIVLPEETSAGPTEVDLGEEPGTELGQVATTADPRPKEFKTLLAKRYQGGDAPPPRAPDRASRLWPTVTGVSAVSAFALGIGLQVREQQTGAFLGYGAGATLAALTVYLLLREPSPRAEGTTITVDDELLSFGYRGLF